MIKDRSADRPQRSSEPLPSGELDVARRIESNHAYALNSQTVSDTLSEGLSPDAFHLLALGIALVKNKAEEEEELGRARRR